MALIYDAQIVPDKLEVIGDWLPGQPWYDGPQSPELEKVAAYRFDDPDGEVGIETLLVRDRSGGPVWQVPVVYSSQPRPLAILISTVQHSELGLRHVSEAERDPVYLRAVAEAIASGAGQAELTKPDGSSWPLQMEVLIRRPERPAEPDTDALSVSLDGPDTLIRAGGLRLTVRHRLDPDQDTTPDSAGALLGRWEGLSEPVPLIRYDLTESSKEA